MANKRKCRECGEMVRAYVTICPYCDCPLNATMGQRAKSVLLVLLLIPVVLIIWAAIFGNW